MEKLAGNDGGPPGSWKTWYQILFRAPIYPPDKWLLCTVCPDYDTAAQLFADMVDADVKAGAEVDTEWAVVRLDGPNGPDATRTVVDHVKRTKRGRTLLQGHLNPATRPARHPTWLPLDRRRMDPDRLQDILARDAELELRTRERQRMLDEALRQGERRRGPAADGPPVTPSISQWEIGPMQHGSMGALGHEDNESLSHSSNFSLPRGGNGAMGHGHTVTGEQGGMGKTKKTASPSPADDFGDIAAAFANPTKSAAALVATPEAQEARQDAPEVSRASVTDPAPRRTEKPAKAPQKAKRGRGRPKAEEEVVTQSVMLKRSQVERLVVLAATETVRLRRKVQTSELIRALLDEAFERMGDTPQVLKR